MTAKLKVLIYGIKSKIKHGEDLETILASYSNLTDEEKDSIRQQLGE
jgi:hypothetical protein